MFFRPEILKMAGYVPGEQPQTTEIIKLNTNENPYPASRTIRDGIEDALRFGLEKYPHPLGQPFRRAASEVLGVPADWILCGNGSDDILTILTRALVGQGERLRLPFPSYILYKSLAEIQGAQSEEVHFQSDWTLGDDFAAVKEDLRLVFLPNPNSPSGTVLPPERIVELADALPCPLLIDEAYADFAETNCLDLVKQNEKIMVSRTLSKSYALAGLRFGYLVAQPHLIEQFQKVKDSYNCDALSIAIAARAIADQDWQAENRAKILRTRAELTRRMRDLGFNVVDSQANFTWNTHSELALKPIFEQLKLDGILVRYMNYEGWGEGLRISVGTDEQITRCVDRIAELV